MDRYPLLDYGVVLHAGVKTLANTYNLSPISQPFSGKFVSDATDDSLRHTEHTIDFSDA